MTDQEQWMVCHRTIMNSAPHPLIHVIVPGRDQPGPHFSLVKVTVSHGEAAQDVRVTLAATL